MCHSVTFRVPKSVRIKIPAPIAGSDQAVGPPAALHPQSATLVSATIAVGVDSRRGHDSLAKEDGASILKPQRPGHHRPSRVSPERCASGKKRCQSGGAESASDSRRPCGERFGFPGPSPLSDVCGELSVVSSQLFSCPLSVIRISPVTFQL